MMDVVNVGTPENLALNIKEVDVGKFDEHDSTPTQLQEAGTVSTSDMILDTTERQQGYVDEQAAAGGGGLGVVFQEAFINGMRDLGYKDPAWAISELIDNSVQAGANTVQVRTGFKEKAKSTAKNPDYIAVVDDGNGMIPEMISYAVRWGGSDRIGDRSGFGRFGYGLPSSCVSIASVYTVYSKIKGGEWHAVHVDLKQLGECGQDTERTEELLRATPASLPKWLHTENQGITVDEMESGTVVVLEDMDRLRDTVGWVNVKAIRAKFLVHLGTIYRHWIPKINIMVDGVSCQAVDPLFLMPHARHYDETKVMARKVTSRTFKVTLDSGRTGNVSLRASILDPRFSWSEPDNYGRKGGPKNERWKVFKDNSINGIIVCREGRQIDVVPPDWTKFQNNDRYLKIELDFDAELDEGFSVTTAKQQIRFKESMKDKLKSPGKDAGNLVGLVKDMRNEFEKLQAEVKAAEEEAKGMDATPLASGEAMSSAEEHSTDRTTVSEGGKEKAKKNLEAEVENETKRTGKSREQAQEDVEQRIKVRPWDVSFEASGEGPFYTPKRLDSQRRVVINTDHPFYSRVYSQAEEVRSALELMLFVLSRGEVDSEGHRAAFYRSERVLWSELLRRGLDALVSPENFADAMASAIEHAEPTSDMDETEIVGDEV